MKLSATAKRMVTVIWVAALILIAACVIYYRSVQCIPFALGVILGAGINIIKVIMLERTVNKSVSMEPKAAEGYIKLQFLIRFTLTAAALSPAVIFPKVISLWGAAAGILTMQVAVLAVKLFDPEKQ